MLNKTYDDMLGIATTEARVFAGLTRKELAGKLCISPRHLMYIETNRKKPSYDLLFRLIRILFIPADRIFHPELIHEQKALEQAVAMLHQCNEKELNVVIATLCAMLIDK
jgi:transcriptional regulator with XRE-family HTH domain